MQINPILTIQLIRLFYNGVIRPILLKAVLDTKTAFDDELLQVADQLMGYKKKGG